MSGLLRRTYPLPLTSMKLNANLRKIVRSLKAPRNFATLVAWYVLFVPTALYLFTADEVLASVVLLSALVAILIAKMDDVASFTLGPLAATLREKIREASATLEEVRSLAAATTEASIGTLIAGTFFLGGMSFGRRIELHDKLLEMVTNIGLRSEQITAVDHDWRRGISTIYIFALKSTVKKESGGEHSDFINSFFDEAIKSSDNRAVAPAEIARELMQRGFVSDDIRQWLDDYDNFMKTGEIRRQADLAVTAGI